jgi:hypothetical protein
MAEPSPARLPIQVCPLDDPVDEWAPARPSPVPEPHCFPDQMSLGAGVLQHDPPRSRIPPLGGSPEAAGSEQTFGDPVHNQQVTPGAHERPLLRAFHGVPPSYRLLHIHP